MAKAKRSPIPLRTLLGRRAGVIARDQHLVTRVEPLPFPVTLYFWFPRQPVPKSGTFQVRSKKGHNIQVADKRQTEAEQATREHIMDAIQAYYPEYIRYLPLCNGSVQIFAMHLMKPNEQTWYPGKAHTSVPDVDNLGKLVKDAPAARTKGFYAVLYWDDCPVDDDWQRKVYWDPYQLDPNYPQQPGTIFVVRLTPPSPPPEGRVACPYCGYVCAKVSTMEAHLTECPLYNWSE